MSMLVTLTGDRQAGKSHAALSVLLVNALYGQQCAYVGSTLPYANHMLHTAIDLLPADQIARILRAAGEASISLEGGGEILFRSHRQIARIRRHVNACVLDDWDPELPVPIDLQAVTDYLYVCPVPREGL